MSTACHCNNILTAINHNYCDWWQLKCCTCFESCHKHPGGLWISSDRVVWMGEKINPPQKKILGLWTKPHKIPCQISRKNVVVVVVFFLRALPLIYPKNSLLKSTHAKTILNKFSYPKIVLASTIPPFKSLIKPFCSSIFSPLSAGLSVSLSRSILDPHVVSSVDPLELSSWGLPPEVLRRYNELGITHMFEWQAQCLRTGKVLTGGMFPKHWHIWSTHSSSLSFIYSLRPLLLIFR